MWGWVQITFGPGSVLPHPDAHILITLSENSVGVVTGVGFWPLLSFDFADSFLTQMNTDKKG
jgi:hypothetical protein